MTSKRSCSEPGRTPKTEGSSALAAPGPPGFKNSVPTRLDGSAAGCLITASRIVAPSGLR